MIALRKILGAALLIGAAATPLRAQQGPMPSWVMPEILAAAKAEGELTVYSSTNEQEALPLLKLFQEVTGVKINFIRGAEAALTSALSPLAAAVAKALLGTATTSVASILIALSINLASAST